MKLRQWQINLLRFDLPTQTPQPFLGGPGTGARRASWPLLSWAKFRARGKPRSTSIDCRAFISTIDAKVIDFHTALLFHLSMHWPFDDVWSPFRWFRLPRYETVRGFMCVLFMVRISTTDPTRKFAFFPRACAQVLILPPQASCRDGNRFTSPYDE